MTSNVHLDEYSQDLRLNWSNSFELLLLICLRLEEAEEAKVVEAGVMLEPMLLFMDLVRLKLLSLCIRVVICTVIVVES